MPIRPLSPAHADAQALIRELDLELNVRYPGAPVYGIDVADFERSGGHFVIAYDDSGMPFACGAFRPLDSAIAEIKRMFVRPAARRRGLSRQILRHLEAEIRSRGFRSIVLETGTLQPEAIALYESEGYFPIPVYLGYVGDPFSRCFAKRV